MARHRPVVIRYTDQVPYCMYCGRKLTRTLENGSTVALRRRVGTAGKPICWNRKLCRKRTEREQK